MRPCSVRGARVSLAQSRGGQETVENRAVPGRAERTSTAEPSLLNLLNSRAPDTRSSVELTEQRPQQPLNSEIFWLVGWIHVLNSVVTDGGTGEGMVRTDPENGATPEILVEGCAFENVPKKAYENSYPGTIAERDVFMGGRDGALRHVRQDALRLIRRREVPGPRLLLQQYLPVDERGVRAAGAAADVPGRRAHHRPF